jgi:predicted house-cleaning NTP pyrophosphatase (Maf/HAM1 superfamily)
MEETSKFNILGNKKLVLGSASPRRRELIAGLGLEVRLLEPIEVDESFPARMQPEDVPVYVSQKLIRIRHFSVRTTFSLQPTLW